MGSKKAPERYHKENMIYFAKCLVQIKKTKEQWKEQNEIDIDGLKKAIQKLPRKDRENIERFWGLTGGTNHCKKLINTNKNDVAFIRQRNEAIASLRRLFRLDYIYMYDREVQNTIEVLVRKINQTGINMSKLDLIKYLIVFVMVFNNGPKMPFECNPLEIDTDCSPEFTFDEYSIVTSMLEDLKDIPDGGINIRLIQDFLEMLDFKDVLSIKKSFCIEVPKETIPAEFKNVEIEPMYTLKEYRALKERVFPYGSWEVTTTLIMGKEPVNLEEFMKCLNSIRRNWSKIAQFKVGQKQLRTLNELRTLDVYNIGGLEFTDIYEVMFLYLERKVIAP